MKRLPKEGIEKVFKGFGSSSGVKIQDDNLDFSDNNFSMELKIECPDFKIIVPQERTFKCPRCKKIITWFVNLEYDKKKSKLRQKNPVFCPRCIEELVPKMKMLPKRKEKK